jgi:broad specificity phosphatase PhoE
LSSKKIYLVRHGQTDFNLQGIVQGSGVDSSLNETGRAQAKAFYEAYKHIRFDKVYTSTLKRTHETVSQFIQDGIPHESLAGLNEISWGSNEGKKITPEEDAYYHWMIEQWQKGNTSQRIEGGESPEDVVERQKPIIEKWSKAADEKTVLVCMHGRAIRILLCQLLNYPLKSMDMFEHSNLCLYLMENTGSMFTVRTYNDVTHLKNVMPVEKVLVDK